MEHTSNTLGIPRQSLRRWSPLHNLQGNFTLWIRLEVLSTLVASLEMVAWLPPCLFFFFFFFLFFFFLAPYLLESILSPGEEGEWDEEAIGEEGKGLTLGST